MGDALECKVFCHLARQIIKSYLLVVSAYKYFFNNLILLLYTDLLIQNSLRLKQRDAHFKVVFEWFGGCATY